MFLCRLPRNTFFWVFPAMWIPQVKKICSKNVWQPETTALQKNNWHDNPNIFINILETSLHDYKYCHLPRCEYITIYYTIVQKHADNDVVLNYLLANIDETFCR